MVLARHDLIEGLNFSLMLLRDTIRKMEEDPFYYFEALEELDREAGRLQGKIASALCPTY